MTLAFRLGRTWLSWAKVVEGRIKRKDKIKKKLIMLRRFMFPSLFNAKADLKVLLKAVSFLP
jgi:hypothetical protein